MHFLRAATLPFLLALPAAVQAVYRDEVDDIDFQHKLLGVPQQETTFFHRPRTEEKASLLYTLSDLGVLGAVNPSNGDVVWRQVLDETLTGHGAGHLRAGEGESWLASAMGGSVQAWDALTGRSAWSLDLAGTIRDLEVMELTENGHKDVLSLHDEDGTTVARRIDGAKGHVTWEFREVTKDLPLQVSTNVEKVFVVTLHGSMLSYSLKVLVLDTLTGKKLDEIVISTKGEVQSENDVMFVGANSAAPIIAWTDNSLNKLKVNVLGTKSKTEFPLIADATSIDIHAPHSLQASPHFLVQTRTPTANKGEVFHIDLKTSAVTQAYELPLLDGDSAFSTSTLGANVYFTRVTPDEVLITSSMSHGVLAKWPHKGGVVEASLLHGVSEVIHKADDSYAVRTAVVKDDDDWSLIQNGDLTWTRPEGLSGAVAATWAEIPESENLAATLAAEAHSSPLSAYIHRVQRHIDDLKYLPGFLQSIPERLISTITGSETTERYTGLFRDSFGFHKLAIIATQRGKLYGIDVGDHGRIVWSKNARETPSTKPWDVRAIHADDIKGFITVRAADGSFIIVHSDTGRTVESMPAGLFPSVEAAVSVDSAAGPWLLPVGVDGQISEVPAAWAPRQVIVTKTVDGSLQGLTFDVTGEKAIAVPAWSFKVPGGQKIVHVANRSPHDPVASIGRVLGDRSVKYKYLNPNTLVVSAMDEAKATLTTYLIDSVSGQILTSSTYEGVDSDKPVECALAENWFACTFYGQYSLLDSPAQSLKGYQLSVSDLYESDLSNDRGPLGDAANFSSVNPIDLPYGPALPSVESKTYILSGPITSLAVTQTKQGITIRQLLAYTPELHSIIGLPHQMLEPRRVVGRDPNAQEAEEGLTRYTPAIDLDSRLMVSHIRDVVGVRNILATPANLESTSLVLAYGVDVFGSRVTPSQAFDILGKGFNKVTLIGTVAALTVGVGALRPMVRKKQINLRWAS